MLAVIAAINGATAIAVAYIGLRQAQVKRTLDKVNGDVQSALDEIVTSTRSLER